MCWQKFYKTMSEIKVEVEYVIKTGRQVVDKKQVDFPDKLSAQLDAIKQQYNVLGAQVSGARRGYGGGTGGTGEQGTAGVRGGTGGTGEQGKGRIWQYNMLGTGD